ncbi:MAG: acetate--CoA ligase family protein [Deltaproteobacteria bacterium]|nr:acetate--CoA ligase family protein [Deltaproteobacteria bacterium]
MEFFFNPQGIAVVGATPNPSKGGFAILKNCITGYRGNIYPVNPRYSEIEGLSCYPSVSAIPEHVDLAIVFVPAKLVPAAIKDCAAKGVPGVMIESGGFAETGQEGVSLQQSIKDISEHTGIRLWGPNCMGLVDAVSGHVFSFMDPSALQRGLLLPGTISLIVQSGLLSAGFLIDIMTHRITGISKVCSVGNKMDVNECDLLPYLIHDTNTRVIGLYLESFADGRRFLDMCRGSAKPIVLLHGGRSTKGAEAAMSHTASMAGNHIIISGALAQAGVTEARDLHQMMDLCRSLDAVSRPVKGSGRIAVLTFSGGAGIVSSDFMEERGLSVAELSQATKDDIGQLFPPWMPVRNPVDLWPSIEKHVGTGIDVFSKALAAVLADPNVDAVFVHTYAGNIRIGLDLADLTAQAQRSGKPVFIWLLGRRDEAFRFKEQALSFGIPVFHEISRAVECLAAVCHQQPSYAVNSFPDKDAIPVFFDELDKMQKKYVGPLDEYISKRVLRRHGIPTVAEELVDDILQCEETAARLGFPIVMKGLQQGKVHKTELGLVRLGVNNIEDVRQSYAVLMEKMNGQGKIVMYRQVKGKIELILGLVRDPQFGPCVMLGLGGIMAEILNDAVFAPAPLTREDALRLISRMRGKKILDGFRGEPLVNREELSRILVALGNMGLLYPRIQEIDVNPLIIGENGVVAVDATIILK